MSKLLEAIRQEYDAALAAAEETGAAPEGLQSIPWSHDLVNEPYRWWERILAEQEQAEARVVAENSATPKAAA